MTSAHLLGDLLSPDRVAVPLRSTEKEALIRELCGLLVRASGVEGRRAEIEAAVLDREDVLSTGIGGGVALPHAKSGALADVALAAGVAPHGVDFAALDGRPVRLAVLLVGPETAAAKHVKVLSRLARLLGDRELRRRLTQAADARAFVRLLRAAEAG